MLSDNAVALSALVIALLLIQLVLRVPIAFALMASAATGLILLDGFNVGMLTMGKSAFTQVTSYTLMVIPMFVAMGMFARDSGLGDKIFDLLARRLNRVPNRLPVAAVLASAAFGAVTGSSVATAAAIGQMSIAEMLKHGVPAKVAAGAVASAGTLGVLIPPSIVLVLYGMATGQPIGALLIAGIIPGLLSALYMVLYLMGSDVVQRRLARRRAARGEAAAESIATVDEVEAAVTAAKRAAAEARRAKAAAEVAASGTLVSDRPKVSWLGDSVTLLRVAVLFGIVIGGIYSGLMTATESAAIGAVAAFVMLLLDRRRAGRALGGIVRRSMSDAVELSVMIFALLVGSAFLSQFITRSGITQALTQWVSGIDAPGWVIIAVMLLVLIPMGMFLEGMAMLLITVPLFFPVVVELGFDPIWFGILMVKVIELGLITPPVGMNVYVVAGVSKIDAGTVFRGTVPFYFVDLLLIVTIFVFPQLATWLPSLMRG